LLLRLALPLLQLARPQLDSSHSVWISLSSLLLLLLVLLWDHVPSDRRLPRVFTTPFNPAMSSLQSYLDQAKTDFTAELKAGKPLANWVIATGNEAGGEQPARSPGGRRALRSRH
jgi:hypothetical protein